MRPTCFRLLAGLLATFCGVACFSSWHFIATYAADEPVSQPLEEISAREVYSLHGVDQTYEMSDGVTIHSSCENLASAKDAYGELARQVDGVLIQGVGPSQKVLYMERDFGMNGEMVGEKVITDAPLIARWSINNVFCKAEGPTVRHLQWRLAR